MNAKPGQQTRSPLSDRIITPRALSIRGGDKLSLTVQDDQGRIVCRGLAELPFGFSETITFKLSEQLELEENKTYWMSVDRVR